jgi:type IV pilus assembly protein PilA
MKKISQHARKGFTLVEIMIVVVIIGLLAAMAVPAFNKVRQTALAKSAMNDARQVAAAADQYFLENPSADPVAIGVLKSTYVKTLKMKNDSTGTVEYTTPIAKGDKIIAKWGDAQGETVEIER